MKDTAYLVRSQVTGVAGKVFPGLSRRLAAGGLAVLARRRPAPKCYDACSFSDAPTR